MKKITPFIFIMAILMVACKQREPQPAAKPDAGRFYQAMNSLFAEANAARSARNDSLPIINARLLDTLVYYKDIILSLGDSTLNPDTAYVPLYIARSADRKLSIVSWDTQEGGTMIDYASVAFYQAGNGVGYRRLIDTSMGDTMNSMIHYDTVVTVNNNGNPIYIARGFGQGSSSLKWEMLSAFAIENNVLTEPAIFPEFEEPAPGAVYAQQLSSTRFSHIIGIEFDLHYVKPDFVSTRPIAIFSDQSRSLQIPVVAEDGGNTKDYFRLQFTGGHYVPVK